MPERSRPRAEEMRGIFEREGMATDAVPPPAQRREHFSDVP